MLCTYYTTYIAFLRNISRHYATYEIMLANSITVRGITNFKVCGGVGVKALAPPIIIIIRGYIANF